ncbi:hypothetical protein TUM4641_32440 [Shewanella morhuae]|nr:hypothetical protein TUM4641_32440 [Shewanella morhuae]
MDFISMGLTRYLSPSTFIKVLGEHIDIITKKAIEYQQAKLDKLK